MTRACHNTVGLEPTRSAQKESHKPTCTVHEPPSLAHSLCTQLCRIMGLDHGVGYPQEPTCCAKPPHYTSQERLRTQAVVQSGRYRNRGRIMCFPNSEGASRPNRSNSRILIRRSMQRQRTDTRLQTVRHFRVTAVGLDHRVGHLRPLRIIV